MYPRILRNPRGHGYAIVRFVATVRGMTDAAVPAPIWLAPMPLEVVAHGALLLHQQCWLWGQDLRSPAGNLLMAAGLHRLDPPEAGRGGHRTRYGGALEGDRYVVVWSGGFAFGGLEGLLCFPRLLFQPRVLPEVRRLADIPHFPAPPVPQDDAPEGHSALMLVEPALDWLARYEALVAVTAGEAHRSACAAEWAHIEQEALRLATAEGVTYAPLPGPPIEGLEADWRALAGVFAR